jgi:serine phosphatase RsbU (regulator of sigma subunit)
VFFFAIFVTQTITKHIVRVRDVLVTLATGELPQQQLKVETSDEIGQMKEAVNDLMTGLRNAIEFAKKIAKGNFDAPFQPLSEKDAVGNALVNMRDGLKIATESLQQTLEESLSQEEELRQNSEELFTLNEELHLKQQDLLNTLNALKESESNLEAKINERTQELSIKNALMTDSIQYAKNIQVAMLPTPGQIKKAMPESFIIYRPKDIVSGDFYWISSHRNKLLVVCADCTGHGVPGAFMSIVGINTFNQIIREYGINLSADLLLNEVNQRICALLKQGYAAGQEYEKQYDGMDVGFCMVDYKAGKIHFAGAGRPLYVYSEGMLKCIKGDKLPIGGSSLFYPDVTFTEHTLDINKGDTVYMFSDGFTDQFNSEDRKKFSVKRAEELITSIQGLSMTEQGLAIEKAIDNWKGSTPQTDDVCIMGFKIT